MLYHLRLRQMEVKEVGGTHDIDTYAHFLRPVSGSGEIVGLASYITIICIKEFAEIGDIRHRTVKADHAVFITFMQIAFEHFFSVRAAMEEAKGIKQRKGGVVSVE